MLKKFLKPLQKAYALEIKIKGEIDWNSIWKLMNGTASASSAYGKFAKFAMNIPDYIGEFVVYKDNEIRRGYCDGLEKKTAVLNLDEFSNIPAMLHDGVVHAHFENGDFIRYNKDKILDADEFEKYLRRTTDRDFASEDRD